MWKRASCTGLNYAPLFKMMPFHNFQVWVQKFVVFGCAKRRARSLCAETNKKGREQQGTRRQPKTKWKQGNSLLCRYVQATRKMRCLHRFRKDTQKRHSGDLLFVGTNNSVFIVQFISVAIFNFPKSGSTDSLFIWYLFQVYRIQNRLRIHNRQPWWFVSYMFVTHVFKYVYVCIYIDR